MSSVNEILYVTSRANINASIKNLRNIAEAAVKKSEHRSQQESGKQILDLFERVDAFLRETDKMFEGIIYSTKQKGKE